MITSLILSAVAQIGTLPPPQQSSFTLQDTGRTMIASPTTTRVLRTAQGVQCGTFELTREGTRIQLDGKGALLLTNESGPFFDFEASDDGRTLLSQGDPTAAEHPFSLQTRMYYDGKLVFALDKPVRTDSVLTLSASGVGLFIYPIAGVNPGWVLTTVDSATGSRQDVDLPPGMRGADPVLCDGVVYFRLFPATKELEGSIAAFDKGKLRIVRDTPGCVQLIQPKGFDALLIRTRDSLSALDTHTETLAWTNQTQIRPRSPFSWATSPDKKHLAILTIDRRRRGEEPKTETLQILNAADGTFVTSTAVQNLQRGRLPHLAWEESLRVSSGNLRVFLVLN